MSEITVPYLPEHQAPDNPNYGANPGYNPPPEVKQTLQFVDSLYQKAKKYRKRYDQRWLDFYKFFRGRQWKEVRPSYRHSEAINVVFQTIQSMIPILTDARPKLEFLPTLPDQYELADILTKVSENDWIHENWLMTLTEILYDAHLYGIAFGNIYFDPKKRLGLGNICFESADPFYFFADPAARDVNESRCKYVIYAEPKSVTELKSKYPDIAQYITGDVIDLAAGDKADIYQVMFRSPTDSKLIVEGPSGYDAISKDQALEMTVYFRDDACDEEEKELLKSDGTPELDEDGQPRTETVRKLKYPNGRKIVVAGGALAYDGEPDEDDGLFPFIRMTNYMLPREFYGISEVEPMYDPQKILNKLISFSLDIINLMSNPVWVISTQAGIDTDNIFNKPGEILEPDDITQVRREPGVDVPPGIMQMIQAYRQMIDGVTGQTDLSRGVEPRDVTAASAIDALQQAQQTRLRQKSRNIDAFLQQFGRLYINRVFQHYSVPRIVRVSGNDNASEYFHFHIEQLETQDEQGNPVTKRIANISKPLPGGGFENKRIEIIGDFDIKVSTGSTLPFAKSEKSNLSMKLFQLGVIDDEELLKNVDYPNYEAVLQRVHEKKMQMQAAQQQAAAAQSAAQAGGGGAVSPSAPPPPVAA